MNQANETYFDYETGLKNERGLGLRVDTSNTNASYPGSPYADDSYPDSSYYDSSYNDGSNCGGLYNDGSYYDGPYNDDGWYSPDGRESEDIHTSDDERASENEKTRRHIAIKVLSAFLLVLICALLLSASPIFKITNINVEGNYFYSQAEIISRSGLSVGQNGFAALSGGSLLDMLAFRCGGAEILISDRCPYVKDVRVSYGIPHTIGIEIQERNRSVAASFGDSTLLIDEEGIVVDVLKSDAGGEDGDGGVADVGAGTGLPEARGLLFNSYTVGTRLTVTADGESRLAALLSVINALRQADRDSDDGDVFAWKLEAIDVTDIKNLLLVFGGGTVVFNLGDGTDLYYRVSAAKEIAAYGQLEGEIGTVLFSNGAKPVFIPGTAD